MISHKNKEDSNRWIEEICSYIGEQPNEYVIKLSLSYLLQSLRNGEDIYRFQWGDKFERDDL